MTGIAPRWSHEPLTVQVNTPARRSVARSGRGPAPSAVHRRRRLTWFLTGALSWALTRGTRPGWRGDRAARVPGAGGPRRPLALRAGDLTASGRSLTGRRCRTRAPSRSRAGVIASVGVRSDDHGGGRRRGIPQSQDRNGTSGRGSAACRPGGVISEFLTVLRAATISSTPDAVMAWCCVTAGI